MTVKEAVNTIAHFCDYIIPCDEYGYRIRGELVEAHEMAVRALRGENWISASERLPEPETDVLTFCYGCIDILTYRYNKRGNVCFMFRDECGYWKETFGEITHWMPLPEPPKEG